METNEEQSSYPPPPYRLREDYDWPPAARVLSTEDLLIMEVEAKFDYDKDLLCSQEDLEAIFESLDYVRRREPERWVVDLTQDLRSWFWYASRYRSRPPGGFPQLVPLGARVRVHPSEISVNLHLMFDGRTEVVPLPVGARMELDKYSSTYELRDEDGNLIGKFPDLSGWVMAPRPGYE